MRKPDKKVFSFVLKDLDVMLKDIIFIDDDLENIAMAKACGWNTCQAYGYELSKIKKLLKLF